MDLKYALRSLRKDPAFSILAVLVMALGIGANTAVFSVVNAVLLRPLAYRDAERIVTLASLWKTHGTQGQVSAPDFHDWHDQSTSFAAMAYSEDESGAVSAGSSAEFTEVAAVSPEFFTVFSVAPTVGRGFTPEEWKSGSGVVIGYAYSQNHFGGAPDAIGKTVRMFDHTFTVVGVMPPGFDYPAKSAVWMAVNSVFPDTESRSAHNYRVVGRLQAWVTLRQAQAEMKGIGDRLERLYPDSNRNKNVAVTAMRERMVGNLRFTLYLLLGAVGMILLIACANMANLLLAKASSRGREMAIRAAVGASRARIVRQLIVESSVLAVVSGAAGVVLARWGTPALIALAPGNVPRLDEATLDARVLIFTLGISLLSSLVFGLAPALDASRVDLNDALKQGTARTGLGSRSRRLRGALVVAEIAISVVLLAGAGLLLRSFQALLNVPLGFRADHVLAMEAAVPASDLAGRRRASLVYKEALAMVQSLPGVTAAGLDRSPPGDTASDGSYYIDHLPSNYGVNAPQAVFSVVSGGVFQTLGIPLRVGRDFNASDTYDAPFTVIVNDSLARKTFPGENPIGHTLFCGFDSAKGMTIVGVVGDIHQLGPASSALPEILMPYEQHPMPDMQLLVRTAGEPGGIADNLRRFVQTRSPDTPVRFTTLEQRLAENVAAPRFRTLLLVAFATLAMLLAMAGVYGVMTYVVGQRTGEIGLRMALGASPGNLLRLILRQGLTLTALGLGLGLAAAMAATTFLRSMLFEVKTTDPLTYAGVAVLLALVALVASYIPARRAMRLDPLRALRRE
jgi:putative ABC transport system permease protein